MAVNLCRVCMISSDAFEYFDLFEHKIFKNIQLSDAYKLITGLDISDDDFCPKVICFRCERQLEHAYHFREMAESSSKHFAAIGLERSTNNLANHSVSPRILNSQKAIGNGRNGSTNDDQWIEITNQDCQNIDVTLKTDSISGDDTTHTSSFVYTVDVNDSDGNIEVKPREVENHSDEIEYSDNEQDEHTDAISFLLNHKNRKKKVIAKSVPYNKRKYGCTVCTKRFVGKSNLVDHLRYHANIRNFKCTFCDKTFVQSGSLKSHLRIHTAEKPYICVTCDKGFGQKSALTVHERTHTKERNYVCSTCSKAFMTSGDLVKHKLIHESVKKFSCDICGMRSAQKVNVRKHKLRVHGIVEKITK